MSWNIKKKDEDLPWPNGENGQPVPPVYLTHVGGGPLDMELTLNLLSAYGIPSVCEYPNNGLFGKLIMGHPPSGMYVFVPETLLDDAQNILNAEIIENEETPDEEIPDEETPDEETPDEETPDEEEN